MISNLWRKQFLSPWNLFLPNSCKLKLYVIDFRFCPWRPPTSRLWIAWEIKRIWNIMQLLSTDIEDLLPAGSLPNVITWLISRAWNCERNNYRLDQILAIDIFPKMEQFYYHTASKVISRVSVSDMRSQASSFYLPSRIGLQVSRWDCRMLNEFICFEYQILTVIGGRNVRYYQCGVDRERR